jgi:hypothetical protein
MPKMIYDCLGEDSLVLISRYLQLEDSTRVQPYGLAEDVLIKVWGSSTLVDILDVDMDPHQQTSIILGALFLRSVKANIDKKGNHQHEGQRKTQEVHLSPQKPGILIPSLSSSSEGIEQGRVCGGAATWAKTPKME